MNAGMMNRMQWLDREDLSDWMSYHQNEKDEWLRYGAGISLRRCPGFEVKGATPYAPISPNRQLVWRTCVAHDTAPIRSPTV